MIEKVQWCWETRCTRHTHMQLIPQLIASSDYQFYLQDADWSSVVCHDDDDVIHMIVVIHDLLNSPGGFCIEQKEKLITAAQERNPSLLLREIRFFAFFEITSGVVFKSNLQRPHRSFHPNPPQTGNRCDWLDGPMKPISSHSYVCHVHAVACQIAFG